MTKSPAFPTSTDPRREATPSEAAALMVAAAKASGIVIRINTHARCITMGCSTSEDVGVETPYLMATHHGHAVGIWIEITAQCYRYTCKVSEVRVQR